MDIPGLKDFYEGLNHQLAGEIEQAANEERSAAEISHGSMHNDDHHDPFHDAHDPFEQVLGATDVDAHQHGDTGDSADHGGVFHKILPAALEGATFGLFKFAAEQLTEAALSGTLLGSSASSIDHHDNLLHVGSMDGDGFTHQTTGFTCAVVSQQMILHQFHLTDPQTGGPLSEARLVYDATSQGWLTDHGTSLDNLGRLLDHYGVANHEGHSWSELIHDLATGHQVVMAVNSARLWQDHGPLTDLFNLFGNHANHAVVVKGLKVDDHGQVVVAINDPAQVDGAGVEYPLVHFQSAIESAHMHYVATDQAPPDWSPAPEIRALATEHGPGTLATGNPFTSFPDTPVAMSDRERVAFLRDL